MTKISVIILTKNSQKHINSCLLSIINQTYPDFEIIIVDAESTDQTLDIIYLRFIKKIKLIYVPANTSIGKARQVGVDNSQGEIIAFIDSDVELPYNEWFVDMMQPLECGYGTGEFYPKEMIAGTQTLSKCRDSDPWILKHLHSSFEYPDRIIGLKNYQMIGTGHCLIRKSAIIDLGGLKDENSYEDLDLTKKIMEKKPMNIIIKITFCAIKSYHNNGIRLLSYYIYR